MRRRLPVVPILLAATIVAAAAPTQAICVVARLISSELQYVYTPGVCDGGAPCLQHESSVSPDLQGRFWILGAGDPEIGPGIDSGTFPARSDAVTSSNPAGHFLAGWIRNYPTYPAYLETNWGASQEIDGCPDAVAPPGAAGVCTAVLLTDHVDGQTFVGVFTAEADPHGNFSLAQPEGYLRLTSLDRPGGMPGGPSISYVRRLGIHATEIGVAPPRLDDPGIRQDAACPEAIVGYRVYQQTVPRGATPPTNRNLAGWILATKGDPGPPDEMSLVVVDCTEDADVYLTTSLLLDGGFETPVVSANSTRVECGPNAADVEDLRPRPRPGSGLELRDRPGKRGARR